MASIFTVGKTFSDHQTLEREVEKFEKESFVKLCKNDSRKTRLGQLGANISPDRSSLMPQVLIGNFLCKPFVVCHKSWEKLYELQHINLLSLYLPKEDGVSPDAEYITQQSIFSIFLQ